MSALVIKLPHLTRLTVTDVWQPDKSREELYKLKLRHNCNPVSHYLGQNTGDDVGGHVHVGCACEKGPLCGGHIERGPKIKTPVFTLERCCNKARLWFATSKRYVNLIDADSLSFLQPHVTWGPNGLGTVEMMWYIWENSVGCMPELNAPHAFLVFPQLLCMGSGAVSRRATHAFHSKSVTHLLYHSVAGSSIHDVSDRNRTHFACKHTASFSIWSSCVYTGWVLHCGFVVSIRGWLGGKLWLGTALPNQLLGVLSSLTKAALHTWKDVIVSQDTIAPVTLCWCPRVSTLNSQVQLQFLTTTGL